MVRRAGLLAALLLAVVVAAWHQRPLQPPVLRSWPPPPSAAEESGGDGPLESAVRHPPVVTRLPERRRPARPTPLRTAPRPLRSLEAHEPAATAAPPIDQDAGPDAGVPSTGSAPGIEDHPAENLLAAPPAPIASPTVMTPPVLAAGVLRYPDGYGLILSRGTFTARLQPEAAEGRVMLRVLVLADGSVARVEVVESSGHPALDEAAVQAAWTWTFLPATRDGLPIDAWAVIPLRYVIR